MMNSLVSVNVGLPQDIAWEGKIIRTAVWKKPVAGRVMVRRLNIDGDNQGDLAGHGGEHRAVMVYQLDSYRHWQVELQRNDFEFGQFGENLTVEGLRDADVCIGDRYRIGGALLEVTQPRVTCYRVGIRMANPQMPSLLVSHGRPGFYCRVIEEGEIGAGDEIIKVLDGPERVTVAEIDALLYLPGHAKNRLERALRVAALSAGWKGSLEALLRSENGNAGLSPSSMPPPAWRGFRSLRIATVQQECRNVLSFVLEGEDKLPLPLPGQYLVFKLAAKGEAALMRSYSLSGPPDAGTYRVTVKRANGRGSGYFHEQIAAGDQLQVSAPRGSFTLLEDDGPVVLLSAGIGATPVLAMLHALAKSGAEGWRQVWWCYGARNRSEHPFADEVRLLLSKMPCGQSLIAYSHPAEDDRLGEHYDVRGHLDLAALQRLSVPQAANFYLCGPVSFLAGLRAELKAWGVADSRIHAENFSSESPITPGILRTTSKAPHPPEAVPGSGPMVSFTRSGLSVPWDGGFGNLLAFAEACDVPVRWSCRVGVCHMCEAGMIGGEVRYAPEPLDRPAEGNVLICCSTPYSAIELDL